MIRPGDLVRLKRATDITAVVLTVAEHMDGSWTYTVQWWNQGERKVSDCYGEELELEKASGFGPGLWD